MNVESFLFNTPHASNSTRPGLKMAAKRYTFRTSAKDDQGFTLLFAHCVGGHKEQWEPVIQSLFAMRVGRDGRQRIREAWAFDWQSHGDSAIVNREALKTWPVGISASEWCLAITDFICSPRMKGHRIVPVGHSAGGATMLLTTQRVPELPYPGLILVEPTMVSREVFDSQREDRMATMDIVVAATSARRNCWTSREEAFAYFRKRFPWQFWDDRVVRLYTKYGLEESSPGRFTLKCDREQEAISYTHVEPQFEGAFQLGRICHSVPIHIIWGDGNNLVPEFIQESLSDVNEGRVAASITKIKDAGHMVVQEQPERLAQSISHILDSMQIDYMEERSKL